MTTQDAEAQRVRSYLLAQGEKYSFAEMWSRLIKARREVIAAVQDVTQEQADFTFAPEEWSIAEVLHHVLTSSARVAEVVESLAHGEEPPKRAIDPPREATTAGISELRERLDEDTQAWRALTDRLPTSPNLEATAPHPFFGELHAGGFYLFQRVHDLDHVGQINKNKSAPGYPPTGLTA